MHQRTFHLLDYRNHQQQQYNLISSPATATELDFQSDLHRSTLTLEEAWWTHDWCSGIPGESERKKVEGVTICEKNETRAFSTKLKSKTGDWKHQMETWNRLSVNLRASAVGPAYQWTLMMLTSTIKTTTTARRKKNSETWETEVYLFFKIQIAARDTWVSGELYTLCWSLGGFCGATKSYPPV